jgi:hypothetical protein
LKWHSDCRSETYTRSQLVCKGLREIQSGGRRLNIGKDHIHFERTRRKPRGDVLRYRLPRKACYRLMVSAGHWSDIRSYILPQE